MHVSAGQYIWQPGDVSHSLYIVINGRLRAFQDTEKLLILGEYGQGDIVGELDVITNTKRSHKLHAIRDTELVRIPLTLFNAISR
jgi:lysophospholipid hydrolase